MWDLIFAADMSDCSMPSTISFGTLGSIALLLTACTVMTAQPQSCEPSDLKLAYPPLARITRVDGSVVLVMRIGSDGRVTITSSSGHSLLTAVSKTMVASSTFPAECSGQEVIINSEYHLRRACSPYEKDITTLTLPRSYVVTGSALTISEPPADLRPHKRNWLGHVLHKRF